MLAKRLRALHFCRQKFKRHMRHFSRDNYFVTTPIFYVNSVPHIGHLYTAVLADAVVRWNALKGGNSVLTTGTDEHGLKIQQAAEKSGISPKEHCDKISKKFKELFALTDIRYTDFIRTTEHRHKEVVNHFWKTLEKNGYIYKGSYEGWYSVSDEAFLTGSEVTDITDEKGNTVKVAISSQQPVVWTKENNYMFKLSAFKDDLNKWLDQDVIHPKTFEAEVRHWVNSLEDLSVSRQRDRLIWGIPVPGDDTQTIYVWLDALVNYLTVSGYPTKHQWLPDCHVVGKDILRFHAVYWPAFLIAAGLPLPKRIQCHSHWLVDHHKMSKSRGNVVDPFDRVSRYTSDGFRYFLLKEGVPHTDCNYGDDKVVECLNSDLCNTLGNLLNRCTSKKLCLSLGEIFPALNHEILKTEFSQEDIEMYRSLQNLPDIIDKHYKDFNVYKAIDCSLTHLRWANKLLTDNKPWELVKSTETRDLLKCLIHIVYETLRVNGILLQPVIPNISCGLLESLGILKEERTIEFIHFHNKLINDKRLGESSGPLFPRLAF